MSSESKTNWADHVPILNTDAELHGRKSGAYSIANLGEGDTPDEAVPGVADTERTRAPVLLEDKNGPSSEPWERSCPESIRLQKVASSRLAQSL